MHLFFEEDGSFKAGTVLAQAGNAYQVQLTTGRRTKIKASHSFFSFEQPSPAELVERAQAMVPELDPSFLWEVAPEGDFIYADLAKEYWGGEEGPVEKAALLWALHGNPVYFYRKGRGGYRRAPADILAKALEALEKKRRLEEQKKAWVREMVGGSLPEVIARQAMPLLIRPDKNGIEWKALSDAASERRQTPLRMLLELGGIQSPWRWHVDSFYAQNFPQGRGFPADLPKPPADDWSRFPLADVRAFSIDDSDTTEVDDAASVEHLGDGRTRVGIHIAAPALGILRDDPLDRAARARMSTVYAPGLKTTMLPEEWIKAFSLDEGRPVPCLSLYVTVDDETLSVEKTETRIERVSVVRNLRYDKIDAFVTEEAIEAGTLDIEFADEICWLWRFARKLLRNREEERGRPEPTGRIDWYFALEGEGEDAVIRVRGRRRGAPLDLLVAELMILANSTWGLWLEEHGTAGIYRSQRMGRVRMSTTPGPHDGLGVIRYAWSTSPLRRYVDLVNQRQMISVVLGEAPVYLGNDSDLFTIVSQFDNLYTLYGDFQTRMERYWSLRWILQENLQIIEAIVVKGDLVRIEGLPFMQRVPGLPEDLERGRKVELRILGCDLVDLIMDSRLVRVLDESASAEEEAAIEEALEEEAAAAGETPENDGGNGDSEMPGSPAV
ncbi:MAG: RNB domain-containing ribonuclease [Sutterella sp.]|nr:RNB domain-containing ribonuclease [Sutterella sp.]